MGKENCVCSFPMSLSSFLIICFRPPAVATTYPNLSGFISMTARLNSFLFPSLLWYSSFSTIITGILAFTVASGMASEPKTPLSSSIAASHPLLVSPTLLSMNMSLRSLTTAVPSGRSSPWADVLIRNCGPLAPPWPTKTCLHPRRTINSTTTLAGLPPILMLYFFTA